MSTKTSRSGGKYCGSHTTVIPAAAILADIANTLPEVSKIMLGYINAGLRSANGNRRVKMTDEQNCIFLLVRDNTTAQEMRIYSSKMQETKLALARGARNANLGVRFKKGAEGFDS